jgi:hypothetical protein
MNDSNEKCGNLYGSGCRNNAVWNSGQHVCRKDKGHAGSCDECVMDD